MALSRREIAFRAIAVTIGVVLPLAVVEGISGALVSLEKDMYEPRIPEAVLASVNQEHPVVTVPDPYLMYRVKPHIAYGTVTTNEYGLREGPIEQTPGPDVFRVLMLGGSVAWGYESNSNEDTIASYLEQELAERAGRIPALRGRRIQVLNGGVPAYVSWQEALLYSIHLRVLRPHWIVTLDGTNDVAAGIHSGRAGAPMRFGAVERALRASSSLSRILWSALVASVQDLKVAKLLARLNPKSVDEFDPAKPEQIAAALRAAAEHLADAARPEGARVLTVLQPMPILPDAKPLAPFEAKIVAYHERRMPGRNRYYAESFEAMRRELAALERERPDFAFADATRVFASTPEPIFTDHCHLTPLGRRILARHIAERLVAALRAPALAGEPPPPASGRSS